MEDIELPKNKNKTKSRKGCLTCKRKRLKCDETKPTCLNCAKKKVICGGYATKYKWKSFNDDPTSSSIQDEPSQHAPKMKRLASQGPTLKEQNKPGRSEPLQQSLSLDGELARLNQNIMVASPQSVTSTFSKSNIGSKSPLFIKQENSDDLLNKHLELASLSVTGKSVQDIKIENEMISRGLNPNTYPRDFDVIPSKKTKRSYSCDLEEFLNLEVSISGDSSSRPAKKLRSHSTNSVASMYDITQYRNSVRNVTNNGLDSLAEVAVDEIRGRSPSAPPTEYLRKQSSQASPVSHQSPFSPNFSDFLNTHHAISSSSDMNMQAPVSTNMNQLHTISKQIATREKDHFSVGPGDLNLTPSLSALINYAFTNEQREMIDPKLNALFDIPLSPLNLNRPSPYPLSFEEESMQDQSTVGDGDQNNNSNNNNNNNNNTNYNFHGKKLLHGNSNFMNDFSSRGNSPIDFAQSPAVTKFDSNQGFLKSAEHEQILLLYSQYTCLIMSIKNGPGENPWRSVVIPLASNYSCLFNSIAAMTLFHLAGSNSQNSQTLRSRGYSYMKKCILELASGLTKMSDKKYITENDSTELPSDIALTTCLNLAVSECWDRHTSSGIAHLKGAKSMIHRVLNLLRNQQLNMWNNNSSKPVELAAVEGANGKGSALERTELQKKLVTVDEGEWERIIQEKKEDMQNGTESSKSSNNTLNGETTISIPRNLQFLFNAWIYFEVLAQMTTDFNQDEKGIDLVATITTICEDNKKKKSEKKRKLSSNSSETQSVKSPNSVKLDSSELSYCGSINNSDHTSEKKLKQGFNIFDHFETFAFNNENVDPLLGCAQSLFLIMGRTATLISKIRREEVEKKGYKKKRTGHRNSLSTITLATLLKQQLMDWKPTISTNMINQKNLADNNEEKSTSTWDMSSCIATAEAYRYSTLLYLHQAVPEIPTLSSHQYAEKVFILLASIPLTSNIHVVHIFPLLVASCEAEVGEEREWCISRWSILSEKMWIGNIDRALEVVKEVWRRKDEETNRRKRQEVEETSFNIARGETNVEKLTTINVQLSGLMAAINQDGGMEDAQGGISSRMHWSSVMKEWGWEVLLA